MRIRSFRKKELRRFYEEGDARGLPPGSAAKLRGMFAVLDAMSDVSELKSWPRWKVHTLTGDRKGTFSLHVSRNWRLTFAIVENEIAEVNLEDYP